jgi:hypothetical protein
MLSHSPAPPSTAQGTHSTSAHLGPPLPSLRLKDISTVCVDMSLPPKGL